MTTTINIWAGMPEIGSKGIYLDLHNNKVPFTVRDVDHAIAEVTYHWKSGDRDSSFIWRFNDGPNIRHEWEGRDLVEPSREGL